jgi:hypothetical protein
MSTQNLNKILVLETLLIPGDIPDFGQIAVADDEFRPWHRETPKSNVKSVHL